MIALDPNQTFEFGLDLEWRRPQVERVVFVARFATGRQLAEMDRLTDQAMAAIGETGDGERSSLLAAAAILLKEVRRLASQGRDNAGGFGLEIDSTNEQPALFHAKVLSAEEIARAEALLDEARKFHPAGRLDRMLAVLPMVLLEDVADLDQKCSLPELEEIADKCIRLARLTGAGGDTAAALTMLATPDLWDLVNKLANLSRLEEHERKKSAWRSASAARAKSAGAAGRTARAGTTAAGV